jgi:hypothetical protein
MADSIKKFHNLLEEVKQKKDHTPKGSLVAFVQFLKGMRNLIQNAPLSEREEIFQKFQEEQKEFEKAMHSLKIDQEKIKDPHQMEKIRKQIESDEFKDLVKQMSEELFSILKIMTEHQGG